MRSGDEKINLIDWDLLLQGYNAFVKSVIAF